MPEANAELKDARLWYENIRPERGLRFARAVEATVQIIADHPFRFPVVYRHRRRAGVRRFPYGVFYGIEEDRIVVLACFHGKRDPKYWQER